TKHPPPTPTPTQNQSPRQRQRDEEAEAGEQKKNLSRLTPLLEAFNHRHRNQHGRSTWWAPFNCLRRAVRTGAVERVRIILPAAFVAFSQLAADNQHAPLGLMLLAILARAHTIVATNLDCSSRDDDAKPFTFDKDSSSAPDRGVVVSRLGSESVMPQLEKDAVVLPGTCTTETTTTVGNKMETGKKVKDTGKDIGKEKEKDKEKEKKNKVRKRRHNNDALSSLFSSLT
ncbi:hypothetical protein CP532_1362, partial [Ophiocordyceps camponoti-leonardi (nom. inval.)]